jgi:hypothetical protein
VSATGMRSAVTRPTKVVLADGTTRPVTTVYDNGWDCPFCGTGVRDDEAGCPNPACVARPGLSVAEVRDQLARWETADRARTDRARDVEIGRQMAAAAVRAREARWTELSAQATAQGACLACLVKSPWQYGTPRFVRHRTAGYHDRVVS